MRGGARGVHGDFLRVFSVFSVRSVVNKSGKPTQLDTLKFPVAILPTGWNDQRATRMDRSLIVALCRDLRNVHVFFEHGHHLTVKVNPASQARDICQLQIPSVGEEDPTQIRIRVEVSKRADARIAA